MILSVSLVCLACESLGGHIFGVADSVMVLASVLCSCQSGVYLLVSSTSGSIPW